MSRERFFCTNRSLKKTEKLSASVPFREVSKAFWLHKPVSGKVKRRRGEGSEGKGRTVIGEEGDGEGRGVRRRKARTENGRGEVRRGGELEEGRGAMVQAQAWPDLNRSPSDERFFCNIFFGVLGCCKYRFAFSRQGLNSHSIAGQ